MDIVVGIIVGLIVLMALVTAHEFGHFLAARRNGVRVLEFGIGFPPRAVAWVREKGKWRKLDRSEWENGEKVTKTVISEGKASIKDEASSRKRWNLAQDGLIFSLNWLPIGGFCQMDGESASDTREGTFGRASFWSKTKILFAGVAMNWLVAWVILTILAWVGMPQFLDNQFTIAVDTRVEQRPVVVTEVVEESPAERAGILEGDYILAVDGEEMWYSYEITDYNEAHVGQTVNYTVEREVECDEGSELEACREGAATARQATETTVTLNGEDAEYLLGVKMSSTQALAYSTWSAPLTAAGLTLQFTGETFKGVGQLVWNLITGVGQQLSFDGAVREGGQEKLSSVGDSVSGPVGIIGQLFPTFVSAGPNNLLFLAAIISISLACMNVLPIPALDGGRWLLIAIYKARKKELTKEKEQKIVSRAMYVLLALILIVTILDVARIIMGIVNG